MPDPSSSRQVFPVLAASGTNVKESSVSVSTLEVPEPVDQRLVLLTDPSSPRADAFRLVRHRLQQRQDPRILAVTSALPGDGKTTCAANLALAIAEERDSSVVILDAHRARPALAELFGIAAKDCIVAGADSRKYALGQVADTGLHVGLMLGGGGPISQTERDGLRAALTDLRLSYEYIVIDTGPALAGMDVHWIAEFVDGLIFAVRSGVTERRSLRRAIAGLMPVPLAGAVVIAN